jgi:hypothetical protein
MYRSRLVPRLIPVLGLIGAPLLIASVVTALFRTDHQITVLGVGFLPVAVWEFSLGMWLIVKGFRPCPITAAMDAASTPPAHEDVVASSTSERAPCADDSARYARS